jgi:hypothetical protein
MVRRWRWAEQHLQLSQTPAAMLKVPGSFFERLTETLCYAAEWIKSHLGDFRERLSYVRVSMLRDPLRM